MRNPFCRDRRHDLTVTDPRRSDRCVRARFVILTPPVEPHGYGEHFDPGAGAEIEVESVRNESGSPAALSSRHLAAVEAEIREQFDFRGT